MRIFILIAAVIGLAACGQQNPSVGAAEAQEAPYVEHQGGVVVFTARDNDEFAQNLGVYLASHPEKSVSEVERLPYKGSGNDYLVVFRTIAGASSPQQ